MSTIEATLVASPTMILPLDIADPTGETPEIVVFETLVTLPFASTVMAGTEVADP